MTKKMEKSLIYLWLEFESTSVIRHVLSCRPEQSLIRTVERSRAPKTKVNCSPMWNELSGVQICKSVMYHVPWNFKKVASYLSSFRRILYNIFSPRNRQDRSRTFFGFSHTERTPSTALYQSYILNRSGVFKKNVLATPKGTYLYCIKSPKRQGSSIRLD